MSHDNHPRVLVVALDAAEPTVIRRLIDQDRMPGLKRLLAQGRWSRVDSPASVGSGAVWPTFMTGQPPSFHGVYGEWVWQPATMSLQRFSGDGLTPFWKELTAAGVRVGMLDVPFAPMLNLAEGFELTEWGAHDWVRGHTQVSPAPIADLVSKKVAAHPFSSDRHDLTEPHDHEALRKLSSAGVAGIRLRGELAECLIEETRPDLAIINFTEIHHCGHFLWHTLAPGDECYQGEFNQSPTVTPGLEDLFIEVDRQIGRLLEVAGNETAVLVFSLHGMGAARGLPAILGPLLSELGFARLAGWKTKSWAARARSLFAGIKRRTPTPLKNLYYKMLPLTTVQRVAGQTMLPEYDWSQTRAFALPSDQHGWIRINLQGREAAGIVPPGEYEETCRHLEALLRGLTSREGKPLVKNIFRNADRAEDAIVMRLPDLIIHWHAAALASPVTIANTDLVTYPIGTKFTGAHELEGFLISRGDWDIPAGGVVRVGELHKLISQALAARVMVQ